MNPGVYSVDFLSERTKARKSFRSGEPPVDISERKTLHSTPFRLA